MNLELSGPVAASLVVGVLAASVGMSYCMFGLGRWLGCLWGGRRSRYIYFGLVAIAFVALGAAIGLLPDRLLDRITITLFALVCTTLPMSLGFSAGLLAYTRHNRTRMAMRTEEWLSEWEREHSDWLG